jgi:hypothetical protein
VTDALAPELGDENTTAFEDNAWGALPASEIKIAAFDGTANAGVNDNRNVTPDTALPTFVRDISERMIEPSVIYKIKY